MPKTKNTDERNQTRPKSREGSRLGRPSVKLSFLPDFIYRSNAISVAIPIAFLKKTTLTHVASKVERPSN